MRLLIATARTQGERSTDVSRTQPGELVWLPELCARTLLQRGEATCMCARSFLGVLSGAPTTTAVVVETDFSRREIMLIMRSGARVNGWAPACVGYVTRQMLALAEGWPTGTVLERDRSVFRVRWSP